jgi:hypothetical protein
VPIHPLLTATLIADTLVLLLVTGAAVSAAQVVLHWSPDDTCRRQLKLQYRQEAWSLATSMAAWIYLAAGFLLIATLTNILPGLVPGAMCGTGVLQSCTPHGHRMLFLRLIGTVGFFCWQRMEVLNRCDPLAPLTRVNARILLVLLPILGVAYAQTLQALTGFDTRTPVDCCTALYDRVAAAPITRPHTSLIRLALPWVFGAASTVLFCLTRATWTPADRQVLRRASLVATVAVVWLVSGIVTLVHVLAPYHYEVLHHYCPWCFFLPAHHAIGFPLLVSWGLVAVEACALWAIVKAHSMHPAAFPASDALVRWSRRRLLLGSTSFVVLAAAPALWWRWQFGLWIGG